MEVLRVESCPHERHVEVLAPGLVSVNPFVDRTFEDIPQSNMAEVFLSQGNWTQK